MNVLVTGGAGFVGSHVVDRLLARGCTPRIFDCAASRYHRPREVETVRGDLNDQAAVAAAVRGCDTVIHLAAVADVNAVMQDPARADRVNVGGTRQLLEAARAEGVSRFLYASTVWVYGGNPGDDIDEDALLLLPAHFYTATKLAGEMYARSYDELFGLPHTILRFGIPYGPRARPGAVVPSFVARALAGKALTIAGDGRQSRQFVYVEDLAAGVVAALAPVAASRVYNLVGPDSVSIRELADTVREIVDAVPIVHEAERPGDLRIGQISGLRATDELGWRAETVFAEGVRAYVDWLGVTKGSPDAAAASMIAGSAAAVLRQEPLEL